jgi:hypothetical protein
VKLTTHLHLGPRSTVELYLHSPKYVFIEWFSVKSTEITLQFLAGGLIIADHTSVDDT